MMSATRNGTFPRDACSAADYYLHLGLAPIPLPLRSKDPGYQDWQNLRVRFETLDEHFPPGKALNLGILNGAPSGNVVDVDLDCIEARRSAALLLPETGWIFERPSARQSHWLYRTDQALDKAQEQFTDLDGRMLLELRGTGGLTVYPPSIHKETGEVITWYQHRDLVTVTLMDLQQSVRDLAAAVLIARHWPHKGNRDRAALALAGALVRASWNNDRVCRFVEAVALAADDEEHRARGRKAAASARKLAEGANVTGWPRLSQMLTGDGPAVVQKVRSWLGLSSVPPEVKASPRSLRQIPPYIPFPVQALPEPLQSNVVQGAAALGIDPSFVALPILAVVASAIGNARSIRLKRGWCEPMVLWAAVVGDSGTLKSPAYLRAVSYLLALQKRLLRDYREAMTRYEQDVSALKTVKNSNKRREADETGERPQRPVLKRVVCSDITIEQLAEVLEDNPRGFLVTRDELAGWLGSFCRYKGKAGGSDLPHWLEMFRAGTIVVDRKTGERRHYFVPRACVNIVGGIQPHVLVKAMTSDFVDAGGAARLLLAWPPKRIKTWSEVEVDPQTEEAYGRLLDRLLALQPEQTEDGMAPEVLELSSEAKAAWVAFYHHWAQEQAATEGEMAAALSKLEGYTARFAFCTISFRVCTWR